MVLLKANVLLCSLLRCAVCCDLPEMRCESNAAFFGRGERSSACELLDSLTWVQCHLLLLWEEESLHGLCHYVDRTKTLRSVCVMG